MCEYFFSFYSLYNGDFMKDKSIWLDSCIECHYPKLEKNIECDILIIGGGITGISCGYFLKELNESVVLVEANQICTGTTSKSTGKLTYLQDDISNKIRKNYNIKTAKLYIESQKDAIELVKKIVLDNNLSCDFEPSTSYLFSKYDSKKLKQNYNLYKENSTVKFLKRKLPYEEQIYNVIEANDAFVFNPTKFCVNLSKIISKKVKIYENTRIIGINFENDFFIAKTRRFLIKCKKIILACHYPFFIYPYALPFKTSIEKSFLCAGETNTTKPISMINTDDNVISLRYYKNNTNYVIFLTNNNTLHKNINDFKFRDDCIWKVQTKLTPNIKYCWSNTDIMTYDYLPLIGKIKNNLYIATGYNTWGLTSGILSGKIIYDIISNNENKYIDLFNPNRKMVSFSNLLNFNLKNAFSFLETKINKQKNFYKTNVKIIKEKGIYYGIYIDENNVEHKVLNRCPHMKCNLYFNYQTKTWDCPCHASSFDIDGNIIYGPAAKNIKTI